jgi:DNA-binding NtrC family response regulator
MKASTNLEMVLQKTNLSQEEVAYLQSAMQAIDKGSQLTKELRGLALINKKSSQTILLVEDDLDLQELISEFLTSSGFKVLVATTPTDAINQLKDQNNLDLLITDFSLGSETSGADIAKLALETHMPIKILLMTGLTSNLTEVKDFPILEKPFTLEKLLATVKQVFLMPA